MKTLGAIMFIRNGIEFDYCFEESIQCMQAFADQVVVLDAGSDDGTAEICKKYADYKTQVVLLDKSEWDSQHGKEKLAYFQNRAKEFLHTEYYMVIQADECLQEACFKAVREAMSYGLESYMCSRINLWFNPSRMLTVPDRQPCSTEVVRLAKLKYDSYGDGESIACDHVCFDFIDKIRIYHMGFVRQPAVMKKKVIHMQEQVFLTPHDSRLDADIVFNPDRYFNYYDDSAPIPEPLPKFVQKWAEDRWPEIKKA